MRAPEATPAPVIARAMAALDRLEQILGMETEAQRRGDLSAGLGHADAKAEAAATYRQVLAEIDSIGPSLATAADADLLALRRRHQPQPLLARRRCPYCHRRQRSHQRPDPMLDARCWRPIRDR